MSLKVSFPDTPDEAVALEAGENLAVQLDAVNSPLLFGCRTGICGTCLIEVVEQEEGALAPPSDDEKELLEMIAPGNPRARLACQLNPRGSLSVKRLEPA